MGSPIANRNRAEIEGLIGFFVNTLVLRTNLAGDPSFDELIGRVREVALEAYANQDVPFEKLVEELQPERDMSRQPLCQVVFALQNAANERLDLPGLKLSNLPIDSGSAVFDLTLSMEEQAEGLTAIAQYSTDLFDASTISRMLLHLESILEGVLDNPYQPISELPLMTAAERERVISEWGVNRAEYERDLSIDQIFEARVTETPEAVAIVCDSGQLTYGELNGRANQLAHYLRSLGVGPESLVGLCLERSPELIVATLAVLKAGGAYLPLDPSYPRERLKAMLAEAQPPVLVTQQELAASLPESDARLVRLDTEAELIGSESESNPANRVSAEGLAYVMYTSGSTGRPKGICVSHRAVVRLVRNTNYVNFTPTEVFLQLAPISFDASTFEMWGALLNGARVAVAPAGAESLAELGEQLRRHGVTTLWLTAGLFHLMVDERVEELRGVRQLLAGGDVLSPGHVERALRLGGVGRVINGYGPTENTTFTCCHALREAAEVVGRIPIGRPIANTEVYVLDERMGVVPVGVAGELYTGGDGLARGYLQRAELTAERFVPHPFAVEPGARLYRTGDLVRWHEAGWLEFLGRRDRQVKLRGFRIELGEIEAALGGHEGVREQVVVVREEGPEDKRLVAYVVAEEAAEWSEEELLGYLKERLPEYMVPAAVVRLTELPLTANGKVERRALPEPDWAGLGRRGGWVAARTPAEELLAGIWSEVLGVEPGQLGVHDNFFGLGGHSLLATLVVSRVQEVFGARLPVRAIFQWPTVAGLAEQVSAELRAGTGTQGIPIAAVSRAEALPLSFAQQRLWFLNQMEPDSPFYNMPVALRMTGRLQLEVLKHVFNEIVRRHEALRTTFTSADGQPFQIITPELRIDIGVEDLSQLPTTEREAEARRLTGIEAQLPFDLSRGPLLRVKLLRLAEDEQVLLMTMHHIVSDGWSMRVLVNEMSALYEAFAQGEPSPLAELPVQYADFAVWQRRWLSGEVLEAQLSHWRKQLEGAPGVLQLPTDRPRPPFQTYRGVITTFPLSQRLIEQLKELSQQSGVTLYMTMLAVYAILLNRYTGQDDILIGSPIANRNHSEIEGLIGFFVNSLVLRLHLSREMTFVELLEQVRETALEAYANQDVPFEKLVEELQPERDMSRHPLFQVVFSLQTALLQKVELPGLRSSFSNVEWEVSNFDLWLEISESADGHICVLEYSTDLFDAATIERIFGHYQTLLEAVAGDPQQRVSELPLLTAAELEQMLVQWVDTKAAGPASPCVHMLFEEQVKRTPDNTAVEFGEARFSYDELNRRANRLAHYLLQEGVGPETPVGLCVERSPEMLIGMLAVLKAGGAYVPLDPTYPKDRLDRMLEDAQPLLVLTQERLVDILPESPSRLLRLDADWQLFETEDDSDPICETTAHNLAYIIYTSGSTGRPKGVAVQHGSLVNYVEAATVSFAIEPEDRVLQFASISFDAAAEEIYPCLARGATLVLRTDEMVRSVEVFLTKCGEWRLSVVDLPTAYWHQVVAGLSEAGPNLPERLRLFIIGGERARPEVVAAWQERVGQRVRLVNTYGPTEATIVTTIADATPVAGGDIRPGELPIGTPVHNARTYVLDPLMQPAPIGVPGELYIAGAGLARGYLGRPDLTAESFVPNPYGAEPGERLYRTGDLACYLADGNLEFAGRIDQQVKVRGFRVELGEIEVALGEHPALREAVVLAREDETMTQRLVAYVVRNPNYGEATGGPLEAEMTAEQVAQWGGVFDELYRTVEQQRDADFYVKGWESSYTGLPIPDAEVRAWMDQTVERVLSLRPRRVLELGSGGSGLMLMQVGPHCDEYSATDVSRNALNALQENVARAGARLPRVSFSNRPAHDFSGVEPNSFDAVLIVSVAQYFPGVDYLAQVLEGAVKAVAPGGFIFLGDIRNYALLKAFHASVQLHNAPATLSRLQLARRVSKQLFREKQLTVDPAFFAALKRRLPKISRVEIQLERGRHQNELTKFRYDVVLHVGGEASTVEELPVFDWRGRGMTLAGLSQLIADEAPEALQIRRVPNSRLAFDVRTVAWLDGDAGPATVGDLLKEQESVSGGFEPEDFWHLAEHLPYSVAVKPSEPGADGHFDVFLKRNNNASRPRRNGFAVVPPAGDAFEDKPLSAYANDPLQVSFTRKIVPQLRHFLSEKMPAYMIPADFVVLDALPLTPGGKLDRRALPEPLGARPDLAIGYVPPRNEVEQTIARLWCETLQVDKVGVADNFFDLGGHSLLVVQLQSRLTELFPGLSVIDLFKYPTVSALADYLSREKEQIVAAVADDTQAVVGRESPVATETDIAVIGMAGRFPQAKTIDEFWRNLCDGVVAISFFTAEELVTAGVDPALLGHASYVRARAVLDDIDRFDASFFGFNPREAESMDPQHRLFLECAWEAIESAGYDPEAETRRIGVFAGATLNTYLANNVLANPEASRAVDMMQLLISNERDHLTTMTSYKLNLKGPSVNVQTSCSTSLTAVHLACQSLWRGECDMALAGGASVTVPHKQGYLHVPGSIYSPDGYCRAFDASAGGTVGGSGVGIVLLKRLSEALADGDQVQAVIRGSAINNDGSYKVGYTAPSVEGEAQVIAAAQTMARVSPESITYVEAHGTGTELGDPIEIAALTQAFGSSEAKNFCAVGSVKTNIGHLDAAAGVAGLIKTVLALRHKQLPPSLHFRQPNPKVDWAGSPFYVNTQLTAWKANGTPRRAGVSSFGIGGTNAHVVLEEAPEAEPSGESRPWKFLAISAKSETALEAATANLADHLRSHQDLNLADTAYTMQVGRRTFSHRRAIVCRDTTDALSALETRNSKRVFDLHEESKSRPVVFMFPGQGSQYVNMGLELYQTEPTFSAEVNLCAELLKPHLGLDLRSVLFPEEEQAQAATRQLTQTAIAQPALFVVEYALARMWMEWGVRPEAMLGHSIGEYVAACLAGVFSLKDALALVALRGQLMQGLPGGTMLAVPLPYETVQPLLDGDLSLASINGPGLCVVAGPGDAVEGLRRRLAASGVEGQPLHTSHAFHSRMMDPILEPFSEAVAAVAPRAPSLPYLSNATGTWIRPDEATDPYYWARHLRQTVRFSECARELLRDPARVCLEVGPGRTLSTLLKQQGNGSSARVAAFSSIRHLHEKASDTEFLTMTLGRLWLAGVTIDWRNFYAREQRRRVQLPTYPFERQSYWVEPAKGGWRGSNERVPAGRERDIADWYYIPSWKRTALPATTPIATLSSRWLVLMDDCGLGTRLIEQLALAAGARVTTVESGIGFAQPGADSYAVDRSRREDYEELFENLARHGSLPDVIVNLQGVTSVEPEAGETGTNLFYSTLYLAQAAAAKLVDRPIRFATVVNRVLRVYDGEELFPEKSMTLAISKVLKQEQPNFSSRYIDVASIAGGAPEIKRLARLLVAELTAETGDPVIAYRGGQRWVQIFEPLTVALEGTTRLREEGVYLVVGGLGQGGYLAARHLASAARAKLIVIDGTALPERREWEHWLATHDEQEPTAQHIRRALSLEQGGELLILRADVANYDEMSEAFTRAREHFGEINGVVYAVESFGKDYLIPLQELTPEECERRFRLKIRGLSNLEALLRGRPLDFCLLFSSAVSVFGGIGFTSYAAGSIFMDGFAQAHNQTPAATPWVSINWDSFGAADKEGTHLIKAAGLGADRLILPDEAAQVFDHILSVAGEAQVIVSVSALKERMEQPTSGDTDAPTSLAAASLYERPAVRSDYVAPSNEAEEEIAGIWQELLGIKTVGIHDNFFELGGHSLLATRVNSRLREAFQVDLPLQCFFESPTIAELAETILESLIEQQGDEGAERALREIEQLSEREATPSPRPRGASGR